MNPIQKQCLVLAAAVMVAMLIYPPWIKIAKIVTPAAYATALQTETQESAGYSWLLEPPKSNSQWLHYESVRIDYARLATQWALAAFVFGVGLLFFKGSEKKSLAEWWSVINSPTIPDSPSNPPSSPPPALQSSEKPMFREATLNEIEKQLQAAPTISELKAPKAGGSGKQSVREKTE